MSSYTLLNCLTFTQTSQILPNGSDVELRNQTTEPCVCLHRNGVGWVRVFEHRLHMEGLAVQDGCSPGGAVCAALHNCDAVD